MAKHRALSRVQVMGDDWGMWEPFGAMSRWWFRYCLLKGEALRDEGLRNVLNLIGGYEMARGKNRSNGAAKQGSTAWTEFVDISLAGVDWSEVDERFSDDAELYDLLSGLLEGGYRVGFSYNPQNDAATCSITCKDEESVNFGKTLTAFGAGWVEALKTALYKHFVVSEQDWSKGKTRSGGARFG